MLSLTDGYVGAAAHRARHVSDKDKEGSWLDLIAPVMEVVGEGLRLSANVLRGSGEAVARPADTLKEGTDIAGELAYLLLMPNDSPTRFKGQPSGIKRVAWTDPISLPEVKAVSHALGCSVNDMLLAAVTGALNGYLAEKGDETEGVEIRALVPVNLRSPGSDRELGNRFGVVALELPVGLENPLARLHEIHRRMEALKSSYEPTVTLGLLSTLGYAPKLVQDTVFDLLLSRATAVMTNVPGPQTAALSRRQRDQAGDGLGSATGRYRDGGFDPVVQWKSAVRAACRRGVGARSARHHRALQAGIRSTSVFCSHGGLGHHSRAEADQGQAWRRQAGSAQDAARASLQSRLGAQAREALITP